MSSVDNSNDETSSAVSSSSAEGEKRIKKCIFDMYTIAYREECVNSVLHKNVFSFFSTQQSIHRGGARDMSFRHFKRYVMTDDCSSKATVKEKRYSHINNQN